MAPHWLDTLTQDDRAGAAFLYPPFSVSAASLSNRSEGGGGCTLYSGSGIDPMLGIMLLFLVVVLVWKRIRRVVYR